MGGHAFKGLHCPRIPPDRYAKVKNTTTVALQTVFTHVTVPLEVPGKADYGDVDFLVSTPFGNSTELALTTFPFQLVIESTKHALNTTHGRRGILTPGCMYFAIPLPSNLPTICVDDEDEDHEGEKKLWVQIDVKICFKPKMFLWMTFELNFASQSSILGSMIKPLGLTLDPEGLHIRVEDMEATDWAGSTVFVTKDPWLVCRVLGLGRSVIDGGFESSEEVYEEYAGSWLFHPETFRAKLEDKSYVVQHSHRAQFLKKWILKRYPDHKLDAKQNEDFTAWTACTRQAVRECVFTRFPDVATKLRELITSAIPAGIEGWSEHSGLPPLIITQPASEEVPSTSVLQPAVIRHGVLTPPSSPFHQPADLSINSSDLNVSYSVPQDTPVYIKALSRQPPYSCKPGPPPQSMSAAARLACLARWTAFSATGTPYMLTSPHPKDFDLQWRDALEAGFSEEGLVKWAHDMWWTVWMRQCMVNWRGMWAKRFEKEDAKVEKSKRVEEEEAEKERTETEARFKAAELVGAHKQKIMGRLEGLESSSGTAGRSRVGSSILGVHYTLCCQERISGEGIRIVHHFTLCR
ncbi:hypothetical protein E8E11_010858 [Didymella keratinophila]|nr:hypothetical protein E8E11_010858 [Didymella keratinophila]